MKTVYLDELFLLNLVIDYFLLLATARICALPFRRGRFFLAAALGALWSALSLLPQAAFLRSLVLRPVPAMVMTLAAFGRERRILRCFAAFLGVSALFGGAVYAAGLSRGVWRRDGALVKLDLRVLALSFAACWAAVALVFRRSVKNAERRLHRVELRRGERAAELLALQDTGNGLYDPVTGRAVLVAEAAAVRSLFPKHTAVFLTEDAIEAAMRVPGARLVPYAGVDGRRRLLLAFLPDRVTVDGSVRDDLLVAVTPAGLGGEGYDAIL